jgi:hypothetical protein
MPEGHDPTDLAGRAQRETELRQALSVEEEQARGDLLWLMSGKRGRRFMHRILRDAGLDESSYSTNAMEMARQEGRKELARGFRRILDRLCPDKLVLMMQEQESKYGDPADRRRSDAN